MNTRRCEASAAIMDGIIYVGGSSGETVEAGKSFESFDPRANKWTQLASMQHDRSDFALVGSNGYLYAMGKNKIIERFDRRANRWTEVCIFGILYRRLIVPHFTTLLAIISDEIV